MAFQRFEAFKASTQYGETSADKDLAALGWKPTGHVDVDRAILDQLNADLVANVDNAAATILKGLKDEHSDAYYAAYTKATNDVSRRAQ